MISELLKHAVKVYVSDGTPPNKFLMAVLANDLRAVLRADPDSLRGLRGLRGLRAIVQYVLDEVPSTMRGERSRVDARIAQGEQRRVRLARARDAAQRSPRATEVQS